MKLHDLLELDLRGRPSPPVLSDILVCRHSARNPELHARLRYDRALLNAYQSEQARDVFRARRLVLMFWADYDAQSLFIGAFDKRGRITVQRYLELFPGNPVAQFKGYEHTGAADQVHYELTGSPVLAQLDGRLVIDWGAGMRSWCQTKLDKDVVEIRPRGALAAFTDYYDVTLRFAELQELVGHYAENRVWHEKLRSVSAVYLILDSKNGEQYVGSASGEQGLLGRWAEYVQTKGHGNNVELKQRLEASPGAEQGFVFSILRVFDRWTVRDRVIEAERQMKERLGTLAHGLNRN